MNKATLKSLLALVLLSCLLFAAGPVSADYMGFTAQSLQTEDRGGGC